MTKDQRLTTTMTTASAANASPRHLEGRWFPSCRSSLSLAAGQALPLSDLHLGENRLGDASVQAFNHHDWKGS